MQRHCVNCYTKRLGFGNVEIRRVTLVFFDGQSNLGNQKSNAVEGGGNRASHVSVMEYIGNQEQMFQRILYSLRESVGNVYFAQLALR